VRRKLCQTEVVVSVKGESARLLCRSEVFSLLRWPELIEAAQRALVAIAREPGAVGGSLQLRLPAAALHLKAGALADPAVLAVKANLRPEAGSSAGLIVAFDPVQFTVRAVLDSADITAMRTAAIAAVAARRLGRPGPVSLAVIGAGPVARHAVSALAQVADVGEVRWWSRSPGRAREAAGGLDLPVTVCKAAGEAAAGADVVLTATPSREPLLTAADLSRTALVLAMGADTAGKRELGPGVLDDVHLVVDTADAFSVGESAYLPDGRAGRDAVALGDLLARERTLDGDRRIVFDSVGSAVVDAAVTDLVLALAAREDVGTGYVFGR
jgi:ornithine cyclodeaminase/alanine dehydrogenase-like protein (mu-crystallin family)